MQTSKTMNWISRKTALILAVLLCAVVISLFSANDVFAAEEDVTTWTACGTCEWGIDPDGCLWIRPTNGVSGTLDDWSNFDQTPWYNQRESVEAVVVKPGVTATTCTGFCYDMKNCESINLSNMDTSNVTSMDRMFMRCEKITSINISNFSTSNVTNMVGMFNDCYYLTAIDVSCFDTNKVTNMGGMFGRCISLTSLDVSGFDTQNVTDMSGMFAQCISLESLDVSGWDTHKVTNMMQMFHYCQSLTSLDLNRLDTSRVNNMYYMFAGCTKLTSLYISGFDTRNVTNIKDMFTGCNNLSTVELGENFRFTGRDPNNAKAYLPGPPSETTTGKWIKVDETAGPYNTSFLASEYTYNSHAWAGVWVWQMNDSHGAVYFDTNGGYISEANVIVDNESAAITMPTAESVLRPQYVLVGWNSQQDGSGQDYEPGKTYTNIAVMGKTTTIYAQWYEEDAVAIVTTNHYQQNATRDGYLLSETEWAYVKPGASYSPETKSYEYFRQADRSVVNAEEHGRYTVNYFYDRETYKIHFDSNGAETGVMDDQTFNRPISGQLMHCVFQKSGHLFTNWNTEQDGTGTSYSDKQPVQLLGEDNEVITLYAQYMDVTNANDALTSSGEMLVTAKGGETIVIPSIPAGTTYTIEEIQIPNGWSKVGSTGELGTVPAGDVTKAEFTNSYSATGAVAVVAHASGTNIAVEPGMFSFVLKEEGSGDEVATTTNGSLDKVEKDGSDGDNPWYNTAPARFEDLVFTEEGEYRYVIEQIQGSDPTIIYDDHVEYVTITVTDNGDGTMSAVASYDADGPLFENERIVSDAGTLGIKKTIVNETDTAEEKSFEFVVNLTNEDGSAVVGEFPYGKYSSKGSPSYILHTDNINDNGKKQRDLDASDFVDEQNGVWYASEDKLMDKSASIESADGMFVTITYANAQDMELYVFNDDFSFVEPRMFNPDVEEDAMITETIAVPGGNVSIWLGAIHLKSSVEPGYGDNSNYGFYAVVTGVGPIGSGTLQNGDTVLLKGGESVFVTDLPYGVRYSISEVPANGWELTNSKNTEGILTDGSATAEFVNTYSSTGSLPITATLICEGMDEIPPEKFSFELLDEEGNVIETVYAKPDGSITFAPIDYIQSQDGSDYVYTIREVVPDDADPYVGYDPHIIELNVHVGDNGEGELVPDVVSSDETMTFRNADKTRELTVSNNVGGNMGDWNQYFDFTIKLTNEDGSPFTADLADPETDSQHLEWTKTGDGEYTFKLKHNDEMTILVPSDVSYEITEQPTEYEMAVTIKKDGTEVENLAEAPVAAGNMADTQTGVEVAFRAAKFMPVLTGIWSVGLMAGVALLLVSGITIIGILTIKKRKANAASNI